MASAEPLSTAERIAASQAPSRLRAAAAPTQHWVPLAFAGALAMGGLLRLWQLAAKPGWQYDEGVYTGVAANLLLHGTINESITYGAPAWSPDLYQPPFYFIVLARWFALTGVSIYHARILGVLCGLGALTLLWRLLIRVHGPRVALYAMVPIALRRLADVRAADPPTWRTCCCSWWCSPGCCSTSGRSTPPRGSGSSSPRGSC